MLEKIKKAFPYEVRKWLYRICVTAFPLLVAAGVIPLVLLPMWLGFIAALLNLSPDSVVEQTDIGGK